MPPSMGGPPGMGMPPGMGGPPGMPPPGPPMPLPGMGGPGGPMMSPIMHPPGAPPGMPPGLGMPPGMPPGMGGPMMGAPGAGQGMPFGPGGSGNMVKDLLDDTSNKLQWVTQMMSQTNPFSESAVHLQNALREIQAVVQSISGSPHPIGPRAAPGFGPGPEGLNPLMQNLPDVPPPPMGYRAPPPGMPPGMGGPPGGQEFAPPMGGVA